MSRYLDKVRSQTFALAYFSISYIFRGKNAKADTLSRLATLVGKTLGRTYIKYLEASSINIAEEVLSITQEPTWMDAYVCYLTDDIFLDDRKEARLLKRRASRFVVMDGWLYRRSFSYPLFKCLGPTDADYVL